MKIIQGVNPDHNMVQGIQFQKYLLRACHYILLFYFEIDKTQWGLQTIYTQKTPI